MACFQDDREISRGHHWIDPQAQRIPRDSPQSLAATSAMEKVIWEVTARYLAVTSEVAARYLAVTSEPGPGPRRHGRTEAAGLETAFAVILHPPMLLLRAGRLLELLLGDKLTLLRGIPIRLLLGSMFLLRPAVLLLNLNHLGLDILDRRLLVHLGSRLMLQLDGLIVLLLKHLLLLMARLLILVLPSELR